MAEHDVLFGFSLRLFTVAEELGTSPPPDAATTAGGDPLPIARHHRRNAMRSRP
jgi:hypothetical protein